MSRVVRLCNVAEHAIARPVRVTLIGYIRYAASVRPVQPASLIPGRGVPVYYDKNGSGATSPDPKHNPEPDAARTERA